MPVVAVLVLTGLTLAVIELESFGALVETSYGQILSVKLALVLVLLGLAALNRFYLTPALARDGSSRRALVRSILLEGVAALGILAAVAGWRFTVPPRTLAAEAATPLAIHIHTENAMFQVLVSPGKVGTDDFVLQLMNGDAAPLHAKEATLDPEPARARYRAAGAPGNPWGRRLLACARGADPLSGSLAYAHRRPGDVTSRRSRWKTSSTSRHAETTGMAAPGASLAGPGPAPPTGSKWPEIRRCRRLLRRPPLCFRSRSGFTAGLRRPNDSPGLPMRLSRFFLPILKENPKEAEIVSHRLMLRAGMIRQEAAGIYAWLPLGLRVLKKIERIVREEQDRAGALELLMPTLQLADLWRESGRYDAYGPEMLRIADRHKRELLYGPTNEEMITEIFRAYVKSYKSLPLNLYHIQWKFRDEQRPRFGVMRGREFLMKDAYSFDIDEAGRAALLQPDVRGLSAHLCPDGIEGDPDARGNRSDRRRSQP